MLSKLERYGFRGKRLDLIKNYFSDRSQYVFLNSKTSKSIDVDYGVPQGSILGPTFFLIYINDMPQCCSNSEVVLYADDTTITSCSVNENTKFSSDVKNVKKWFDQNCLTINENKCMLMPFGHNKKAKHLDGVFKDVQIKDQCIYLGITFDKSMKFTYHCKKVAKKLATFSAVAYRARNFFTKNQLLIFYNAYEKSTIEYGLLIYGNT